MKFKITSLRDRCHVNSGSEKDSFVGIKNDGNFLSICFPLGYQLPNSDQEIRRDICNLIHVLSLFDLHGNNYFLDLTQKDHQETIPLQAYIHIIHVFLSNGYYLENERKYENGSDGKIDWSKTIKTQIPYLQNNSFVFSRYVTENKKPSEDSLITKINKFCVYESFEKMFWLFGNFIPEKPNYKMEKNKWISFLNFKLCQTNNENNKRLFQAMLNMINYLGNEPNYNGFYFGTNHFEYVWQWMVDKAFGISCKEVYFPHSFWIAKFGKEKNKKKSPLLPDTIMNFGNECFVLDSKYYKYGESWRLNDLPNSSDIYKQIAYGKFIESNKKFDSSHIFNAFIIPFNSKENKFICCDNWCLNVAEAIPEKIIGSYKTFERIQAILIDTRWLLFNFCHSENKINQIILAKKIKDGLNMQPI